MNKEIKRIGLIIFMPIYLPLWLFYAGNTWEAFNYYFKAIFSKNLLEVNMKKQSELIRQNRKWYEERGIDVDKLIMVEEEREKLETPQQQNNPFYKPKI